MASQTPLVAQKATFCGKKLPSKIEKMETKTDMCTMISSRRKSGETNLVRVMTRKNSMAFNEQGLCLLSKMAPLEVTKPEKVND